MRRKFDMIDVFGSGPVSGNPLAVVHEAEGLSSEEMLAITRWLNLSETTFLLPPSDPAADYRVRIFTLLSELPFAGHPTLGTCHAWLEAGGVARSDDEVVQECGAGLVRLRTGDRLSFAAPDLVREGPLDDDDRAQVLAVLGVDDSEVVEAAWVDNGPGWVAVLFDDHERVLGLKPAIPENGDDGILAVGAVAPHPPGSPVDYEIRAFFPTGTGQLLEDPVTGSLNASIAQWLIGSGRAPDRYTAAQGTVLGRSGRVHIQADDGQVWVGGDTVTLVSGEIDF